jgi:hypothetical protein
VNRYLFTRLLVCGDCGSYLHGWTMKGRQKSYACSKYREYGSKACYLNRIFEKQLWTAVLDRLMNELLDPTRLDEIEQEIERRLKAERSSGADKKIKKQIAALEKDIAQGNARLLLLPEDRLPSAIGTLRTWEKEREGLLTRLKELETGDTQEKAILAEARKQLWRLREGLEGDDVELQAAVVRELVSKIEVKYRHEQKGRVMRHEPEKVVLYVRPGLGIVSLAHSVKLEDQ